MKILASINCITYNHEKYIEEAIESFLMQKTNFKFEILIHDDASTDRTSEIIREYQKKYPDIIKPILQKENQYSKGIDVFYINQNRAQGKYIAICEGDDYWTDPYKLQKQVNYMEGNSNCSMCFHATELVRVGKGKIGVIKPYNKSCISPTEDIILGGGEFIATNSILYRKEIMVSPPDFYINAPIGDYPLQILCSTKNYAYYINEVMSVYRIGVEGSWVNMMISAEDRVEKYINLNMKIIDMLNEFNKYSNRKFSIAIDKKIQEYEFKILKLQNKIEEMKNPRYKFIYKSLKTKEKIKIYIRYYFPKIYCIVLNLRRCIKK